MLRHWTPTVQAMVERSGGAQIAADLRSEWNQGLVTLITDSNVLAVVEARAQPSGARELVIHAINGKNALPLVRWLCELGRAKHYKRLIVEPRSKSRERLYKRMARQLRQDGAIKRCQVVQAAKQQTQPTSARTSYSPTQVMVTL